MMRWSGQTEQSNFAGLLTAFSDYARPFREMWPFFWLKAAAVQIDGVWRLTVFSLNGLWSDNKSAAPVDMPHGTVAAISKRLDASSTWQMLESMANTNTLELAEGIIATVPDIPLGRYAMWQEQSFYVPDIVRDVAEEAQWWYFNAGGQEQWLRDSQLLAQAYKDIPPSLEYLGEQSFATYISSRFYNQRPPQGNFASFDSFNYHLSLPLALRININSYMPAEKLRQIDVDCHAPLLLSDITITEGDIPAPNTPPLAIEEQASTPGGWAIGHSSIAQTTNKVRLSAPQLGRILSFEFAVPQLPEIVANAVGFIYASHDATKTGAAKWEKDLLNGSDAAFEVALLNAIARLNIAVLFGGQFKTSDGQTGGTATPGFDLLALDYRNRRAVAISAKGTSKLPTLKQLENLRKSVDGLRDVLHGWTVFGLVACHAPQSDFARWRDRPSDLNVWGPEHLQLLLQASSARSIAWLLWVPPGASEEERMMYLISAQGN